MQSCRIEMFFFFLLYYKSFIFIYNCRKTFIETQVLLVQFIECYLIYVTEKYMINHEKIDLKNYNFEKAGSGLGTIIELFFS